MPYYFYQFNLVGHPRYDHAIANGYPAFMAGVIRPVVQRFPHLRYYFQRIPVGVQWCLDTRDFKTVGPVLTRVLAGKNVHISRPPAPKADSLVGAFGGPGSRFLANPHHTHPHRRAELVLKYLQGICDLLLDNLVPTAGGNWEFEQSADPENPLGSNFESLAHLLANITGFQFEVQVDQHDNVRTAWMNALPNPPLVARRCVL